MLSRDPRLLERVRRLANLGFLGTREAALPGVNAKLSEYAAAIGLAGLDTWRDTRARWAAVTRSYRAGLHGMEASPGFGTGWVGSTLNVLLPGAAALPSGIGTLRWWGGGCHAQPAYRDCPRQPLPVTEDLARRCTGLPFWQDLPAAGIAVVCAALPRQDAPAPRALVPA